jgi:hypothetical protein
VIGEPTFADAILDRLVHNAYRLAVDGPSLRKPSGNGLDDKPGALEIADPQRGLPMNKEKAGGTAEPEAKAAKASRERTSAVLTKTGTLRSADPLDDAFAHPASRWSPWPGTGGRHAPERVVAFPGMRNSLAKRKNADDVKYAIL